MSGPAALGLLALVVVVVDEPALSPTLLATLETASLAWSALAVAVSATRSLLTLTVLLTSPVRRWTPGFSFSLLAASTICWRSWPALVPSTYPALSPTRNPT